MKVALTCIARDEDNYIEEWINYNLKLGFDDIFIYQHNWRCNVEKNNVHKIEYDGKDIQVAAYNHFIQNNHSIYDWVAFFDVDEFLVLKKHKNIKSFLSNYKDQNAIGINWVLFGDNNLTFDGRYSVLERFTKRSKQASDLVKCIVKTNPNINYGIHNPHNCIITDTHYNNFYGDRNDKRKIDIAQINHYYCKTWSEWEIKKKRNTSDDAADNWYNVYGNKNTDIYFHAYNINEIEDTMALDFYLSNTKKNSVSKSISMYRKIKGGDTNLIKKNTNENSDTINSLYENVDGWFDFENLYSLVVNKYDSGSKFVEVGVWKGKSAIYMATKIINSGKKIKFDCVDTWLGSEEYTNPNSPYYEPILETPNGLYDQFLKNIEPVKSVINPIRMKSIEASKLYADESLDFIFIDAAHDYQSVKEDITVWLPKLKKNGIIAGHDYTSHIGVKTAVDELLSVEILGSCWLYEKIVENDNQIKQKKDYVDISKNDLEVSVVLAHIKTKKQKDILTKCLSSIKTEKILSCNSVIDTDIQPMTDWCIYNNKNELLFQSQYKDYNVKYYQWKTDKNGVVKTIDGDYDHGYAVYNLIKNGLLFAKSIGKEIVHVINYDYIVSPTIIQKNSNLLLENDMVLYEFGEHTNTYSTAFFSGKVDSLLKFFQFYNNKKEYYSDYDIKDGQSFLIEGKFWKFYKKNPAKILKKSTLELKNDPDTTIDILSIFDF